MSDITKKLNKRAPVLYILNGKEQALGTVNDFHDYGYGYYICNDLCKDCGRPLPLQLTRAQGLAQACAFKEFRFEPPYVAKRKERKRKKLPPIPELMMPKRHNSFDLEEEEEEDYEHESHVPSLPVLSISPAFITEKVWP